MSYCEIERHPQALDALERSVERFFNGKVNSATAHYEFLVALREAELWELAQDEHWYRSLVDFNTSLRWGWRQYDQGCNYGVLLAFPTAELLLLSRYPAGERYDWQKRWVEIGGTLAEGRMVARKDSEVWSRVGDFGFPFPPFSIGSGMWVKGVLRSEAFRLGVLQSRTETVTSPRRIARPGLILFDPVPEQSDQFD